MELLMCLGVPQLVLLSSFECPETTGMKSGKDGPQHLRLFSPRSNSKSEAQCSESVEELSLLDLEAKSPGEAI